MLNRTNSLVSLSAAVLLLASCTSNDKNTTTESLYYEIKLKIDACLSEDNPGKPIKKYSCSHCAIEEFGDESEVIINKARNYCRNKKTKRNPN